MYNFFLWVKATVVVFAVLIGALVAISIASAGLGFVSYTIVVWWSGHLPVTQTTFRSVIVGFGILLLGWMLFNVIRAFKRDCMDKNGHINWRRVMK